MNKLWFDDMIIFLKFVISNHHVRGDFFNAHFVGNNHEAAVSNLFAEGYSFSKPCFYCTNHLFAKNHSSLADKLIAGLYKF